jgi:hypothetical protein
LPGDVKVVDDMVRTAYPDPCAVVPEPVWNAEVEAVARAYPSAGQDERGMLLGRLMGLLDTHTQFFKEPEEMYDVWIYRFSDGSYVVAARDEALVGARLVSIAGTPIAKVERALARTIPADNRSAVLNGAYLTAYVDHLHGLGIVRNVSHPAFELELPGGTRRTVDLGTSPAGEFLTDLGLTTGGAAEGDFTEAVRRRAEPLWWRTDRSSRTFLLSVNGYVDTTAATKAMDAALDSGRADRVVVDLRYLRGGDWVPLRPLVDRLRADRRVNDPAKLSVLIGRENESAATVVAYWFDTDTKATLIGEPTPARADPFTFEAKREVTLPDTGYLLAMPTTRFGNGDKRRAVMPDVRLVTRSTDFFAGRDVTLDFALHGR